MHVCSCYLLICLSRLYVYIFVLVIFYSIVLYFNFSSGVYGTEDYYLTDPMVIILLPSTPVIKLFNDHLPHDLQSSLSQHVS